LLTYLQVSDFALIESVEVEFKQGLNVLTGETGAGKTVLVGAIGLLLGDRADSMQVRDGSAGARFSAIFDLSALPRVRRALEAAGYFDVGEDELLLGRTVSTDGKSRCTINGRLSPVSALSEVGEMLVEVHGQNTHQALLKASTHLEYLDRFVGGGHLGTLEEYAEHFARLKALIAERSEVRGAGRDLDREAELLAGEIESIDRAEPRPGEIEELEADARRMRHGKELWELALRVEEALSGDERSSFTARQLLTQAAKDLRSMVAHDSAVAGAAERLESLMFEVDDVAAEVARYREALDTDPAQLEETESRLSLLRDLCRRHAETLEGVLEYRDRAAAELEALERMRRRAGVIDSELEAVRSKVAELAAMLARGREAGASKLEKAVVRELAQLELSGARFEVSVGERQEGEGAAITGPYGPAGSSDVEFLFSSDGSSAARPLRRIASGGEMSRVMLALKIVLADADRLPILIFDEVDAGIGGETAGKVGEKLRQLTSYHQVFCVTHIPQIATYADWQYRVFKGRSGAGARTGLELLDDEGRVDEMCRMLGDASGRKVTREHARDILARARK
jgi:DNA repair protein RecN (Recombination protein N)